MQRILRFMQSMAARASVIRKPPKNGGDSWRALILRNPSISGVAGTISNSVKYAGKNPAPTIQFSVADHADSGEIILSISDNGTGIPVSDLPFVFDKGFTGDTGSYLSRSTGMGLYLVRQMANDLTLKVSIFSNANGGTTVTLMFPKVEQPLRR